MSKLNPTQTIIVPPVDVPWRVPDIAPPDSVAEATLAGSGVPVYPGGFVRRVAGTPHYDGTRADAVEPAVIAVSGTGPVRQEWVDPSQLVLRRW